MASKAQLSQVASGQLGSKGAGRSSHGGGSAAPPPVPVLAAPPPLTALVSNPTPLLGEPSLVLIEAPPVDMPLPTTGPPTLAEDAPAAALPRAAPPLKLGTMLPPDGSASED